MTTQNDLFTYFQQMGEQMMNPMKNAGTAFGVSPAMQPFIFPTSVEEVDKKIAELTTVKAWLETTTSTIGLSIKALEYQRSLLNGIAPKSEQEREDAQDENSALNPAAWAWDMMQKAGENLQAAAVNVASKVTEKGSELAAKQMTKMAKAATKVTKVSAKKPTQKKSVAKKAVAKKKTTTR
jgi:hypothetical protein